MMAAFSDVFADVTKQGTKLQTSEYLASGKYPIIDQGQDDIAGYTDREDGLFTDVPAIIFGDHTRIVKYVDTPFFLGADGVKVLKATIPDVDYRYLYYAVSAVKIPNTGYNRHFKWLKEAQIPLPDISTQRRIADTLDKVAEGIALCRKMMDELDLMVKAKFQEMFGDENYPHTELINLIKDGMGLSYGIVQPGDDGTGEMGVLRPVDMVGGKISMTSIKYIDRSIGDGFRKTELTGDELLITVRGTTGVTALTDARFTGMNVTRGIAVIRYDREKINPVYLNAYLNTDESQRYIQEHTRGATLQQINLSDLRIQDIVVPPINLQNRFAAFIAEVDKSKLTVQRIRDKMEMEKLALMQEYFK